MIFLRNFLIHNSVGQRYSFFFNKIEVNYRVKLSTGQTLFKILRSCHSNYLFFSLYLYHNKVFQIKIEFSKKKKLNSNLCSRNSY